MAGHALPLLLWTAAVALFFWPMLSGRVHIANGDFSGQFHAFGLFQMRELVAGRFPLWSAGSFSGFPFAADPQVDFGCIDGQDGDERGAVDPSG